MKKNAAIYARVSSLKQKEGDNIQSQVSTLIEYSKKQDYLIPDGWLFKDEGFSGSTLQRPALDSLREIIQEGIVDIVLIYSPDRLSRKYAYQLLLEMEFQKRGVEIFFFNTPKAQSPEEQLSVHFKGIFAEYERVQIIERCRRGRIHRAKQGSVSAIPTPPLGYDYIKKSASSLAQYVINKDSHVVKKIFNFYVHKHISISTICRELELEGISSPHGRKKWCTSTVRDILKNEAYIGTAHFGKTEHSSGISGRIYRTPEGEKRSVPVSASKKRPKELWIPIRVPQIILENDFEIAQVKLQENIKTSSRNTQVPSILQGLLVCGYCGGSYYKKVRSSKYSYYSCGKHLRGSDCCGKSVKQKELDDRVWEHIIELLKNPQLIEKEIDRRATENQDSKKVRLRLEELDKEQMRLSKARDKLLDAYQEGECLDLFELKERLKTIGLREKATQKEQKSLEEFASNEEKKKALNMHVKQFQERLEKSKELSITDKQNVLRLLISEIIITGEHVDIRHCIPCSNENAREFSPLPSDGYAGLSGLKHVGDTHVGYVLS